MDAHKDDLLILQKNWGWQWLCYKSEDNGSPMHCKLHCDPVTSPMRQFLLSMGNFPTESFYHVSYLSYGGGTFLLVRNPSIGIFRLIFMCFGILARAVFPRCWGLIGLGHSKTNHPSHHQAIGGGSPRHLQRALMGFCNTQNIERSCIHCRTDCQVWSSFSQPWKPTNLFYCSTLFRDFL